MFTSFYRCTYAQLIIAKNDDLQVQMSRNATFELIVFLNFNKKMDLPAPQHLQLVSTSYVKYDNFPTILSTPCHLNSQTTTHARNRLLPVFSKIGRVNQYSINKAMSSKKERFINTSPSGVLLSDIYFPTLSTKRYNPLKIKQLIAHQAEEKQNISFRKKLQLKPTTTILSKTLQYQSFRKKPTLTHPSFQATLYNNRRTLQFYNAKKKKTISTEKPPNHILKTEPIYLTQGHQQLEQNLIND